MQNHEQSNMPDKKELRLKFTTRIIGFFLAIGLLTIPVLITLDLGTGIFIPMVITGASLILISIAVFFVFPVWYRYRHVQKTEDEAEETELFP